jgi:cytosine/adenosine deaminase-related metal-dependent hydrolase
MITRLALRDAGVWDAGTLRPADLLVDKHHIAAAAGGAGPERTASLGGRAVLPGMINAHDRLAFSSFPPLGRPPYASAYDWAADIDSGPAASDVTAALTVPLPDRLFLGGLRNLLAGATSVVHHDPYHRALGRRDFPVRVLSRYHFAHSPGLTPALRRTYRTTDRRIPWLVRAGEGTDDRCRAELQLLADANVLRQNTVVAHAVAFGEEDARRMAAARTCVVWCPESNRRLYAATANVRALRAAGVRIGLGSDSPMSGARDALSSLSAARAEGVLGDVELVDLATRTGAEVARMPLGGTAEGDPADLVVLASVESWLRGERPAIALVMVGGRALYGEPGLLDALGVRWAAASVDGAERALEETLAERAAGLLRRHPALAAVSWLEGIRFGPPRG